MDATERPGVLDLPATRCLSGREPPAEDGAEERPEGVGVADLVGDVGQVALPGGDLGQVVGHAGGRLEEGEGAALVVGAHGHQAVGLVGRGLGGTAGGPDPGQGGVEVGDGVAAEQGGVVHATPKPVVHGAAGDLARLGVGRVAGLVLPSPARRRRTRPPSAASGTQRDTYPASPSRRSGPTAGGVVSIQRWPKGVDDGAAAPVGLVRRGAVDPGAGLEAAGNDLVHVAHLEVEGDGVAGAGHRGP